MLKFRGQSNGSSPRVRGTGQFFKKFFVGFRFIPACAGNSHTLCTLWRDQTVHPRVCGEQAAARSIVFFTIGSSPRVRGTGSASKRLHPDDRFIPACAGNRGPDVGVGLFRTVHPRVCGEQALPDQFGRINLGSSPRVRGTVISVGFMIVELRFIPACAGNRSYILSARPNTAVHPRVCGEQARRAFSGGRSNGSSPRVRGTAEPAGGVHLHLRFIPACAGNSRSGQDGPACPAVHPRVCGEQP